MKEKPHDLNHGLRTPREEIAFTARPKIQSQSQIFRYGRSLFCLPHRPNFSDIFDLCLHWASVVRDIYTVSCIKFASWFMNKSLESKHFSSLCESYSKGEILSKVCLRKIIQKFSANKLNLILFLAEKSKIIFVFFTFFFYSFDKTVRQLIDNKFKVCKKHTYTYL